MVFIIIPLKVDEGGTHPKFDEVQTKVDCFLDSLVSVLAKYLTALLIVVSLIEGYILIASTEAIVTFSFFNLISSSFPFRSEAWTMEFR